MLVGHGTRDATGTRQFFELGQRLADRLKENPKYQIGAGVAAAYKTIREAGPYQAGDAWWGPEIEKVKEMVLAGELAIASGD